tara:strand:- start:331 stop:924 length:594 start_codon:yes stop_codon:yes gene_type:complete
MSFDKEIMFKDIPDKRQYKETTSLKFKKDLIELFGEIGKDYTILEVGTNHGHTTRILSFLFKDVITLDWREEPNLRMAKELNPDRDNITYIEKNVYTSWDDLNLPKFQVSFIDCDHEYQGVISDINNCIKYGDTEQYLIFDDYGHPTTGVKRAVHDVIDRNDNFNIVEYIGEPKGSDCRPGLILTDYEGVICKYESK